jgi:hypothetical protein
MCKLTDAEARLTSFINDNPQITFTEKNGGGHIRMGSCRWTRTIKKTIHEDCGDTAITLGYWPGKGWIVGLGRADSAGSYRNSDHIHDRAYDSFYKAATAFLEAVDHLI